jgi:hypothetical protein
MVISLVVTDVGQAGTFPHGDVGQGCLKVTPAGECPMVPLRERAGAARRCDLLVHSGTGKQMG